MDLVIKMAEKAKYEEINKIITTKEPIDYKTEKAPGGWKISEKFYWKCTKCGSKCFEGEYFQCFKQLDNKKCIGNWVRDYF